MTKIAARQMMLKLRDELTFDEVKKSSQALIKIIQASDAYLKAKTIGLFYPIGHEIDLRVLLNDSDKTFFFPKVEGDLLYFYEINEHTTYKKSHFGVFEPTGDQPFQQTLDLIIVPALAISKDNHRIGYGKGFYDRYIKMHPKTYTLGVIYAFQEVETFDTDNHDQPLDHYIKI